MDIHHLKVFIAVYRNRSFSKASRQLYLSQPTVSEHVRNLEKDLGCRLFDRTGRAVIPTREADLLYSRAVGIVEGFESLAEELSQGGSEMGGKLVIGASTIPGTYILPVVASDFKEKHTAVSFEIIIGDSEKINEAVLNHELALGAVGAREETDSLDYVPFVEDELVLALSRGMTRASRISVKEIATVPFLLREEGSGTRKTMEEFLGKRGVDVGMMNVAAVLGSTDSVKQALKAGLGASILSRIAVAAELKDGSLKEVKIRGMRMKRKFYLVTHKKRTLSNPYKAFYEHVLGFPFDYLR